MILFNFKKIVLVLLIISSLSLFACFGGSSSIPDDHYYRLPELVGEKLTSPILVGTLSIKRVITHGIYGERTLIYTDNSNTVKLNRYHYHHWEKSPSHLIQDNLEQYLKLKGIAHHVISHSQNTNADYLLEVELITLHRDMSSDKIIAAITLDIKIYNRSNNSIYLNKRYHSNITTNSSKLVDTIDSYGIGFKKIYDELITDLQSEN